MMPTARPWGQLQLPAPLEWFKRDAHRGVLKLGLTLVLKQKKSRPQDGVGSLRG